MSRESQRRGREILKPVEVHSVADIKRLVAALDPHLNPPQADIPLTADLTAPDGGKSVIYRVETNTRSKSRRDMLVEGLTIIKKRVELSVKMQESGEPIEVNGVEMRPAQIGNGIKGNTWVDPLIRQWLGGFRDGTTICWDLNDGYIYRYDIFTHRLTRTAKT